MGQCCAVRRRMDDSSLQHELNAAKSSNNDDNKTTDLDEEKHETIVLTTCTTIDNNSNNNHNHNHNNNNEASLNSMSVTISHFDENHVHDIKEPVDDDDDDLDQHINDHNDDNDNNDNRYHRLLRRMRKRKNIKKYLTTIKKSNKQLFNKKKKLQKLLLDNDDNESFNLSKNPKAPKFKKISARSCFDEISFTEWIIKKGVELNDIINDLYDNNIGYIPDEISITITTYTLDLLPGIYEFEGKMDYNGTDDDMDEITPSSSSYYRSGWGIYGQGGGNKCTAQIILNSRSEIIGGYFSENSFKYHITNGSYTYDEPNCIEFTKEYFNYNCKYKVYGQILRDIVTERLTFKGHWKLLNGSRGGNVKMRYIENKKGCKQNEKLKADKYCFYGHCDYLPNTDKRYFFDDKQRIKCHLNLNEDNYHLNGTIDLLNGRYYETFGFVNTTRSMWDNDNQYNNDSNDSNDSNDNNKDDNIFNVDERESEWDIYGGIHIQLTNGYVMEGFFNGEDFMGVWKDENYQRFGHFHYELFNPNDLINDDNKKNIKYRKKWKSKFGTASIWDNDDEEKDEKENDNDDVLISSTYLLNRAKSLDSDDNDNDDKDNEKQEFDIIDPNEWNVEDQDDDADDDEQNDEDDDDIEIDID